MNSLPRCGIALDAWLFPIHEDTLPAGGISKPLLFINSHLEFQWKRNVQKMLQLVKEPDERGISTCQVLTIKYCLESCYILQYITRPNSSYKHSS